MKILSLLFVTFIGLSMQASTPTSPSYVAGVVEFSYEKNQNVDRTASNLQEYLRIMALAPELDIIVFPESTLNNMTTAVEVPEPQEKISPCNSDKYLAGSPLKEVSCAAKNYKRYVVVNMSTKVKCPDAEMIANKDPRKCSARADGLSYYNTNLVFDRNGTLISRYRKFNLFGEKVDKPLKPHMSSFDTDFGVKFGHFICFDLAFRFPAMELVRTENITDIIFPTMWFSEMPFLTAAQVQQNWAFTNNVNLLAAGANFPDIGSTGTGIYARRMGPLVSVMEGANKTSLYTAIVPKKGLGDNLAIVSNTVRYSKQEMESLYLKQDVFDRYKTIFLPDHQMTPDTSMGTKLCHEDTCCDFHYSFKVAQTIKPRYYYALAVYHGNRTFDGFADGGIFACAVLACQTKDNATSCGARNETLEIVHEWHKLEVTGTFPHGDQFLYMPTTLDTSIMPYSVSEFEYIQRTVHWSNQTFDNYDVSITMKSVGHLRDFYAFGIYGRDFNLDSDPGAAGTFKTTSGLVVISLTIAIFMNLFSV